MRLALALAAVLLAGCGGDSKTAASTDLAQPELDLSIPGLPCGGTSCTGACAACVELLGGVCATPCNTSATPSTCSGGTTCRPANSSFDGGTSNVTFAGTCSGYDGVCL